jgi:hypothetical protein
VLFQEGPKNDEKNDIFVGVLLVDVGGFAFSGLNFSKRFRKGFVNLGKVNNFERFRRELPLDHLAVGHTEGMLKAEE